MCGNVIRFSNKFYVSSSSPNTLSTCFLQSVPYSADNYDYAVPEVGTLPLLSNEPAMHNQPLVTTINSSDKDSLFSKGSSSNSKGSKSDEAKGKKVNLSVFMSSDTACNRHGSCQTRQ